MTIRQHVLLSSVVVTVGALLACGGNSNGGTSPSPNPAPGGATITITSNGASPKSLTVSRGTQVSFVNNDSRPHEMHSDPHPTHGDCVEINQVGPLSPGQTRQTGPLATARTCGYHDHSDPTNASLQGTITTQ